MAAKVTVPSAISATSISKSLRTKLRLDRLRINSGPLPCCSSLLRRQRILSPEPSPHREHALSMVKGLQPCPLQQPRSPRSLRRTIPETRPPTWSLNSS